jgi:hypothetical protein
MSRRPYRNLWTVRLEPRLLALAGSMTAFLRAETGEPTSRVAPIAWRFALCGDELAFARQLLGRRGNLWIYRCNQQRFCGDFVVVDMSSPRSELRPAAVLDLKRGSPLREGGGGASNQLCNARHAVRRLAWRTGIVSPEREPRLLVGDRAALLGALGVNTLAA